MITTIQDAGKLHKVLNEFIQFLASKDIELAESDGSPGGYITPAYPETVQRMIQEFIKIQVLKTIHSESISPVDEAVKIGPTLKRLELNKFHPFPRKNKTLKDKESK